MGLFGGINAVNEINSLIAQIERNMNALAMGHRTKRFFQWSGKMGERF